jgi:alpha-ribazole phosphatase
MTTIFFIRHGVTLWNKSLRYQGQSDIELSEEGLMQADKVAQRLAVEPFSAVYSSDLRRAVDTAQKIAAFHSLPVIELPGFREISFGRWEGLTYDQIKSQWPNDIDMFFNLAGQVQIPGGESFHDLHRRSEEALQQILRDHPDQCVAVVSHGGVIRTMLCAALKIDLNLIWSFRQDNTAVSIVEYTEDYNVIRLVNDAHHLYPASPIDPAPRPTYNVNRRF